MPLEKTCPSCGKSKGAFIGSFCVQCYLKEKKVLELPEKLEIWHCKRCDKISYRGKWREQSSAIIEEIVKNSIKPKEIENEKISMELEPKEKGATAAKIKINGEIQGKKITLEKEMLLVPKETQCDPCMRVLSYYHEGILQIRFKDNKDVERKKDSILREIEQFLSTESKKDPLAVLIDVVGAKNGFDVLISSKKATRKIAAKLASKYNSTEKVSYSLVGLDKLGREKKRFTFCVRI